MLRSAFAIAAEGTALAGAALRIRGVPLGFACRACGRQFGAGPTACPACGSADVMIAAGREVQLVAIEVEEKPR
jgi:Zn finger protein HypA/HybF involved in hydrogenase expression